jgi:uncharacterized protein
MKARAPAPLFEQALTANSLANQALTPTPLQSPSKDGRLSTPYEGEGATAPPRSPSPSGRRWPEGPDEGLAVIGALDWPAIERELDAYGCAIAPKLLSSETCRDLAALYPEDSRFRSRIVMGSHGFGKGEYKYFAYPLPELIVALRRGFYSRLAAVADRWNEAMGVSVRYPAEHDAFLARCHQAGQKRPTPLLLRYGPGDYNCLHQDVYGSISFRCNSRSCSPSPGAISPAANSC